MIVRFGNMCMLLGIAAAIAATAWWLAFFHEILGDNFQAARDCFYWTTDLCSLKEPASLFSDIPVYDPALLWLAGALFAGGLCLRLFGLSKR